MSERELDSSINDYIEAEPPKNYVKQLQWDMAIGVLNSGRLERDVHNKAIQKAVESFRISDERKALLRSLRRR